MRKTILFFSSLCFIFSCTSDHDNFSEEVNTNNTAIRSAGDTKYDVLGYGYDVTKPYASKEAVTQYQIIDVQKLIETEVKTGKAYFDKGAYAGIENRVYSAEDYSSYSKSITNKTNFSGSVASFGIEKALGAKMFSADVKANQETKEVVTTSTAYSYATAEIYATHRRFILDADISLIQKYLNINFKTKLDNIKTKNDAYNLVEAYGTHVLLRYTTGGVFKMSFQGMTFENGSISSKTSSAEIGAKYGLDQIGIGATAGWSTTTETEMKNKFVSWYGELTSSGGSTNGLSINISATQGTSYNVNVGNWTGSINDNNAVLVDLDWNKTYPLHMLISDKAKAKLVENAINEYIKNNCTEEYILYPLFRYWNNSTQGSYLSNQYESRSGWIFDKIIGYSTEGGAPETGAYSGIYQFKHKKKDIYLSSLGARGNRDPRVDTNYDKTGGKYLGHIKTDQPKIMNKYSVLYRFRNNKTENYLFTDNLKDPRINSSWIKDKELGYLFFMPSNY